MSKSSFGFDPKFLSEVKKPNFFLLGAGRCGTTTLYHMLRQHPEVYMPDIKEPSFFCSYFQVVKDPISYFSLFSASDGHKAVGEASHVYFSNPESAPIIHLLFPNAKFILILRDPVRRAFSLYRWTRHNGLEDRPTFEEAIIAEKTRFRDRRFFSTCPHYFWNFMYIRSSYYHIQLRRYLRFYPLERFFVLSLYELTTETELWMRRIYQFLGVSPNFTPSPVHLNAIEGEELNPRTKILLERHFRSVISDTTRIVGRDLRLTHR